MKKRSLTYFRGTNIGDNRRIRTGECRWDSYLFMADRVELARAYGRDIEEIVLKPESKILYEGTREFKRIGGKMLPTDNMLTWCDRLAQNASQAGYDAVHFTLQGTIGTAVMNRDIVQSRKFIETGS